MEQILNASSLARDIKHVFDSICNNTIAHIILNDFIDLSLQIPTLGSGNSMLYAALEGDYYSMIPDLVGTSGSGNGYGYECDTYPILCPYHALLLLNDPEEVLQNVPMDSSPTLIHLVQMLTPTLNLHELSMLLDCSLAQVYRLSAHLIYWRKAKLIHTIAVRNIYIVSPQANLSEYVSTPSVMVRMNKPSILSRTRMHIHVPSITPFPWRDLPTQPHFVSLSALTKDFNKHIPTLDLPFLLASLSTPRPFSHIIPSKDQRTLYLEAITYLLRKDLVIQLHQYFVLMVPRHVQVVYARPRENEGETGEEADAVGSSGDQGQPELPSTLFELDEATTVVSGPGQATEVERGWVLRLAEEKGGPKEVIELFQSYSPALASEYFGRFSSKIGLVHYFNGKHHIEEILWRNRITRKQLRMVTEWFRDELVSVYHY
ncbi:nitrogen permease regulator of amino acid transport activity 3-domain-containing protein [Jimgerdemannia flammicorona]|uniref:Nitrogen permease regulator 3 n=1 Tax=Jimgerdemannia flammicorona TaxID=994334 RepID=A0A433QJD2_9FUNG|nr:nitrogen permease regulator of amino acid transport activity 3-domain-containing protein [Jimgerdemannia flammicorona]